jgi:serine/threonine-protein kinase RsbW
MSPSISPEAVPMDGATLSLTLPSEPRMLTVARSFVEAVCQAHRLDRTTTHALVIVTGEAITNIVRHAHQNRPGTQMEIHLQILADVVVMTFKDEGEPFDLSTVPDLPPGELRIGGRGIYLMRTLMDELTCQPCPAGKNGNVLRMVKKRECGETRECG